jgi:hypothetical protein
VRACVCVRVCVRVCVCVCVYTAAACTACTYLVAIVGGTEYSTQSTIVLQLVAVVFDLQRV